MNNVTNTHTCKLVNLRTKTTHKQARTNLSLLISISLTIAVSIRISSSILIIICGNTILDVHGDQSEKERLQVGFETTCRVMPIPLM